MDNEMKRLVMRSAEGKSVWLGGLGVDFKIWGEQTQRLLAVPSLPT